MSASVDPARADATGSVPEQLHVVVVLHTLDKAALRALSFAEAHRPRSLVALHVCTDTKRTAALMEAWARRGIDLPLTCSQPTPEDRDPILSRVVALLESDPAGMVMVVLPVIATAHRWQRPLHRYEDPSLRRRLSFLDRVLIAEVPWQLHS